MSTTIAKLVTVVVALTPAVVATAAVPRAAASPPPAPACAGPQRQPAVNDGYEVTAAGVVVGLPGYVTVPAALVHSGAAMVAAGEQHVLVLGRDGTLYSQGPNTYGEIGRDGDGADLAPVMTAVAYVAAGRYSSFAVATDGSLYAFGGNWDGQLGVDITDDPRGPLYSFVTAPVFVMGDVTSVAGGDDHTLVLKTDGSVWSFGSNDKGELGVPAAASPGGIQSHPQHVMDGAVAVAAGNGHSLVLTAAGDVYSFGWAAMGQLGRPAAMGLSDRNEQPGLVMHDVVAIAAGTYHSLALKRDGTLWGWGYNSGGPIGPGAAHGVGDFAPAPVFMASGVTAAGAGAYTTQFTTADGRLWTYDLFVDSTGHAIQIGSLLAAPKVTGSHPLAAPSRFVAVAPRRVLDTRAATARNHSGPKPVAGTTVEAPIVDHVHVPDGATAAVVNITVTEADGPGFVQAYPTGHGTPGASSNLNVNQPGQTIANAAIVPIGTGGSITLFTQSSAHLLVDVMGYMEPAGGAVAAGRLVPVTPTRIFDTRPESRVRYAGAKPGADSVVRVKVAGRGPIPASGVSAAVLNITATQTDGAGFVQVAPAGQLTPGRSSNINVERAGQTIPNQVLAPLGADGSVDVYVQAGTHLVVDAAGYFTDGTAPASTTGLFVPVAPARVLDTRTRSALRYFGGSPAPGCSLTIDVADTAGLPPTGIAALALNLTITGAHGAGYLQAAPAGHLVPGASSNVNAEYAGQTIPNAAIVPISITGLALFDQAGGDVIADVSGWFTG